MYLAHLPTELLTQALSYLVLDDLQQDRIYEHYPWANAIQQNARFGKDYFVIAEHYTRLRAAKPTGVYRFKKLQQWNLQEQTLVCVDIYQNIFAVSLMDSRVLNIPLLDRAVRELNPYVLAIWPVPDGVVIQLQLRKTGSFMAIRLSYAGKKVWKLGPSLTLRLGSLAIGQDSVFEISCTKQVWKVIRCDLTVVEDIKYTTETHDLTLGADESFTCHEAPKISANGNLLLHTVGNGDIRIFSCSAGNLIHVLGSPGTLYFSLFTDNFWTINTVGLSRSCVPRVMQRWEYDSSCNSLQAEVIWLEQAGQDRLFGFDGDRSISVILEDGQVLINQLKSGPEGLLYIHVSRTLRETDILESHAGNSLCPNFSLAMDSKQHEFLGIQGRYIYQGKKHETKFCCYTDLTIYKF